MGGPKLGERCSVMPLGASCQVLWPSVLNSEGSESRLE